MLGEVRDTLAVIPGSVPNLINLPPGCKFAPALSVREGDLRAAVPPSWWKWTPGHKVRCYMRLPETQAAVGVACGRADWHFFGDEVMASAPCDGSPPTAAEEVRCMPTIATANKDLLVVDDLKKYFPVRCGLVAEGDRLGEGRGRRELPRARGRDVRPGGRVGLRQDDHRADDPAPDAQHAAARSSSTARMCSPSGAPS